MDGPKTAGHEENPDITHLKSQDQLRTELRRNLEGRPRGVQERRPSPPKNISSPAQEV